MASGYLLILSCESCTWEKMSFTWSEMQTYETFLLLPIQILILNCWFGSFSSIFYLSVLKLYLHCPSNHGPKKCLPQHKVPPSQRPWGVCHYKKTTSSQATTVAPFQNVVSWCSQHVKASFKAVYRPLYLLWKRQCYNACQRAQWKRWWTMWEKCWL